MIFRQNPPNPISTHIESDPASQFRSLAVGLKLHADFVFAGDYERTFGSTAAEKAPTTAASALRVTQRDAGGSGMHVPSDATHSGACWSRQPAHRMSCGIADRENKLGRSLFFLCSQLFQRRIADLCSVSLGVAFFGQAFRALGLRRLLHFVGNQCSHRRVFAGEERVALIGFACASERSRGDIEPRVAHWKKERKSVV